jgi:transcriptional regulator with XRE-family HTH domain
MDPAVRGAVGLTLRRHRLARSMTQRALGQPMTRSYVSSVEAGRTTPSLPALRLMVLRLDMTLADFFSEVDGELSTGT